MFYLRLNQLTIQNPREGKDFGLFGKIHPEYLVISFATSASSQMPIIDDLRTADKFEDKRTIVRRAIQDVASTRQFPPIDYVRDYRKIRFSDAGVTVWTADSVPNDLTWTLVVLELDSKTRDRGKEIDDILKGIDEKPLIDELSTLLKLSSAAVPQVTAAAAILRFIGSIITTSMKRNKDDQVGLFITSLIKEADYPNGIRNKDDDQDLTGNMKVDYSLFSTGMLPH